jgi:hypothetical protein
MNPQRMGRKSMDLSLTAAGKKIGAHVALSLIDGEIERASDYSCAIRSIGVHVAVILASSAHVPRISTHLLLPCLSMTKSHSAPVSTVPPYEGVAMPLDGKS